MMEFVVVVNREVVFESNDFDECVDFCDANMEGEPMRADEFFDFGPVEADLGFNCIDCGEFIGSESGYCDECIARGI